MNITHPVPDKFIVTQSYTEHCKRADDNGWYKGFGAKPTTKPLVYYYPGLDLVVSGGCDILAAAIAPVTVVSDQGSGYGMHVRQEWKEDGNNWLLIYAHMERGSVQVKVGQVLKTGNVIGRMGYSGNCWPEGPGGMHLHFELRKNGIPVDPEVYLSQKPAEPILTTEPTVQPLFVPALPETVKAKVISDHVEIRRGPEDFSVWNGRLGRDQVVDVLEVQAPTPGSVWARIGYQQWCAIRYMGVTYLEFLSGQS